MTTTNLRKIFFKNKATLFCPQGPRAHLLRKHGYRSAAFIEYFHKL